jgi:hypothetical protein
MKIFFTELYFELKKNRGAMIGIVFILYLRRSLLLIIPQKFFPMLLGFPLRFQVAARLDFSLGPTILAEIF